MRASARFLAIVLVAGCATWHPQATPSPRSNKAFDHRVRVVRKDHSEVVLREAYVVGDSLVGRADTARVAVALSDIDRLDQRELSFVRTGGLLFGLAAVAVGALLIVSIAALTSWG